MSPIARLFWGSLVVKLALLGVLPLTNDEAYYWVWSQHPQLSYFDHPPFVAWLFGLGEHFRFIPGGVRWPGALLAHAGLAIWLSILRGWLGPRERFWWLALSLTSPLLGGSQLIITPDVPLLFFFALAIWTYLRWLAQPSAWWSLGLGLAVGLGFTSKYMMVLFPLALVIPTLRDARSRRAFARGIPLLTLGLLVGTYPVWAWNIANDLASFRFQAHHGLGRTIYKPSWTTDYIGLQLALITPWLGFLAWRGRRTAPAYLTWLAITPLLFFLSTTARGYAEANWPIAAYPALFSLSVSARPARPAWWTGSVGFFLVLVGLLCAAITWNPAGLRATKLREFHQFDAIIARTRDVTPLYARSYQMASRLSFELDRPVFKVPGMLRHDFFDELPEANPPPGTWYFVGERDDRLPDAITARGVRVTEVTPIDDTFELRKVESR